MSVTNSRVLLLDLDSGATTLLAGGGATPSVNYPVAFDDDNDGVWIITDQGSEFTQLAWLANEAGATPEIVTTDIPWNVTTALLSHDRKRLVFVTNEDGRSRVYFMDPESREYQRVNALPTGLAYGLRFSPDDKKLGMTLNLTDTPSDAFVLTLGDDPLSYGELTRWTESEVGGLDTTRFRTPELVHYPTFDEVDGNRDNTAWVYKPRGKGPHPVVISIHGDLKGKRDPHSQAPTSCGSTNSA